MEILFSDCIWRTVTSHLFLYRSFFSLFVGRLSHPIPLQSINVVIFNFKVKWSLGQNNFYCVKQRGACCSAKIIAFFCECAVIFIKHQRGLGMTSNTFSGFLASSGNTFVTTTHHTFFLTRKFLKLVCVMNSPDKIGWATGLETFFFVSACRP